MRLIDAEPFDIKFMNVPAGSEDYKQGYIDGARHILEEMDEAQTVDAVPVVPGMWIHPDEKEDGTVSGRCSHCGWEAHYYEDDVADMPYCPNCGTKMDLEEQDA